MVEHLQKINKAKWKTHHESLCFFPHGTLLDFHLSLVPESPFHYTGWLVRIPIRDCDNAQDGE